MRAEFKLTYYGIVLSKKNSKRIIHNPRSGRPIIVSNASAKRNEGDMATQFALAMKDTPITKCALKIDIYEPTAAKRDLDNQATSILDALVKAEVIVDDSFKCVDELSVRFAGIDRKNPRAVVYITPKEDR